MSMMWDKKKTMEMIMARRKAGGGERIVGPAPMKNEVVKTDEGEPDGRHLAAQDALAAFHEKSAQKFAEAMANFMDLHSAQSSKPDPTTEG